jgi:3-methyladenine DNA glycosylase AlkD
VAQWARSRDEFVKRAAFALLACMALHDKERDDTFFLRSLSLDEMAATDERNFVKKGVSWALRLIGRRNRELNVAAISLAERLNGSGSPAARWVARDVLKDLKRPAVIRRLETKAGRGSK